MRTQESIFGDDFESNPEPIKSSINAPKGKLHSDSDYPASDKIGKVITIRGTNGSGKSTVIRRVFDKLGSREARFINGRSMPYYYLFGNVAAIGSYENSCGGCDSIPTVSEVYEIVKKLALSGRDVIYEGLLHSCDVIHTAELPFRQHTIYLSTSQEDCIESVKARRAEAGNEKPYDPKNLIAKYRCCKQSIERIKTLAPNADVYVLDRESAYEKVCELLNINKPL